MEQKWICANCRLSFPEAGPECGTNGEWYAKPHCPCNTNLELLDPVGRVEVSGPTHIERLSDGDVVGSRNSKYTQLMRGKQAITGIMQTQGFGGIFLVFSLKYSCIKLKTRQGTTVSTVDQTDTIRVGKQTKAELGTAGTVDWIDNGTKRGQIGRTTNTDLGSVTRTFQASNGWQNWVAPQDP